MEGAALLRPEARAGACTPHIIGVSVSERIAETPMAMLSVTANSRKSRPMTPPMKRSGMSTATSDTVSETMVKPICLLPLQRGLERTSLLLRCSARCSRS